MLLNFIKSLIIGFAASVPLGPIGILCIQKTISKGKGSGVSLGLGAALVDMFLSILCIYFLSFIDEFLAQNRDWVLLLGGIILGILGIMIAMKNPVRSFNEPREKRSRRYATDALQGFLMAVTNPGAPILLLSIFALVHFEPDTFGSIWLSALMPIGILIGGMFWWYMLCSVINRFRKRFQMRHLLFLNRICGVVIAAFGVIFFIRGGMALL